MNEQPETLLNSNRRQFVIRSSAILFGGALSMRSFADSSATRNTLEALLTDNGYDGSSADGAVLGIIADPHSLLGIDYPYLKTERWDDSLIGEMNELCPLMTDIVIAGDLISHFSMTPGLPRYPLHEQLARQEYEIARSEIGRFDSRLRVWAVPGNHDTDAYESDAELWREMLGIPAYRKAMLGGVPVFFLNSGNGGMLNFGQLAWFRAEVARIPDEQDIVVVMHHPVFFAMREEAAMKRVLCQIFGGRKAKVWILSGHGHSFAEQAYLHNGTSFVQMEVTGANPKLFSDNRSPGYIVMALQGGRIISRLFRSILETGYNDLGARPTTAGVPVRFQFDEVAFRMETFDEGLYDHSGRVLSFSGVHVGSYFAYLKRITFQVRAKEYLGRPAELILAGTIPPSVQPTCMICHAGEDGTWETLVFPGNRGGGLFRIPIPETYRTAESFQLKVDTGLTASVAGFSLSGWALAADPGSLSPYRRWLQRVYGHLRKEEATAPLATTPGTPHVNLINFAFGLAVPERPGVGVPIAAGVISGLPCYAKAARAMLDFRFARRRTESLPGVRCVVERSRDFQSWEPIEEAALAFRNLDSVWQEVSVSRIVVPRHQEFLRVGVVEDPTLGTGFSKWKTRAIVGGGPNYDINDNGIDDLLEYCFDLGTATGGLRRYDPERVGAWAGLPYHGIWRATISLLVFPRMRADANPGITYVLEWSVDMEEWNPVPAWLMVERVLRSEGDWDEVEVSISDHDLPERFYRVSLSEA